MLKNHHVFITEINKETHLVSDRMKSEIRLTKDFEEDSNVFEKDLDMEKTSVDDYVFHSNIRLKPVWLLKT